ncbi:DUF4038 domain-containing protein [Sulfitobacter sabulilitoris]|uniref:DUF4038 domain-containing protein n=1 Tax=Sulfitobacter sabulilitoris TaxID=2562655 RepID=A0A5S3P824_9RHOB|nr:DUF4038 domain-containing protein [Sulfitobacter sabulilitoris]TMM49534.1 DUF4038 domain-containing protein [Sulfitobacter sabulilitoris]
MGPTGRTLMALAMIVALFSLGGSTLPWRSLVFPLSVSTDQSHLLDAEGRPVLIVGDAAWSLMVQLRREDVELYLEDRKARGFNALLVSIIEHQFSSNPPANAYGMLPFNGDTPFAETNEDYFDHVHWVLRRAEALGFAVFLTPAYIGTGGGGQGWYGEIRKAGPDQLRSYGQYLGRRFGDLENIIWTQGGDEDSPDPSLVSAIAEGIRATDPNALQTVHSRRDTVTAALWEDASWLDLDTAYTYQDVFEKVATRKRDRYALPVIMIESLYENEHGTTEQFLREAAYGAIMAGAAGYVFGNNPIWHFSSGGLFDAPGGWKEELSGAGSVSMSHMRAFFEPLDWWLLMDDADGALCGWRTSLSDVKCAVARNGAFAIAYLPSGGTLRLKTGALTAGPICAAWYDPSNGTEYQVPKTPLSLGEDFVAEPPRSQNFNGSRDWLLRLTACDDQ